MPPVLGCVLAERQAARERLWRTCLLSILLELVLLGMLLPLSLPALQRHQAPPPRVAANR